MVDGLESADGSRLRILVDQSGYDLRNLGDVAMLQACVRRLQALRPAARIAVLCHDSELLAKYCPTATAVPAAGRAIPHSARARRIYLAVAQVWKVVGPYTMRSGSAGASAPPALRGWRDALRWADIVVASGGGFLTDTWWWHGSGVLSVLRAAQRMGKPTAMFGQGLGPLTHRLLRRQAATVLPRLGLLGLRGRVTAQPLAGALGVPPDVVLVTGDDALELVDTDSAAAMGEALGVNVRLAAYSGVDAKTVDPVGEVVGRLVADRGTTAVVLPVSLFGGSSDATATRRLLAGHLPPDAVVQPELGDPAQLAATVRQCRVVVTGSYHAAVFALASGVPAVGLSKSAYYDAKFSDLADLFPGAVWPVRLGTANTARDLGVALDSAWSLAPEVRAGCRARCREQVAAGRAAYRTFLERAQV